MGVLRRASVAGLSAGALGAGAYLGVVSGALPIDLGVGRRTRPLGPLVFDIGAPRELVFDVITEPYAERTSRAMQQKVRVLERGRICCWPRTTPRLEEA